MFLIVKYFYFTIDIYVEKNLDSYFTHHNTTRYFYLKISSYKENANFCKNIDR